VSRDDRPAPERPGVSEVSALLEAARTGDRDAAGRLYEVVVADLRRLAAGQVRRAPGGAAHQTTSLVHEAWLRLTRRGDLPFESRGHFLAVAARAMRQIVIDDARARRTTKRGGGAVVQTLDEVAEPAVESERDVEELLALDAALERLRQEDEPLASVVEQHFFAGLTFSEIAEAIGVSERTVQRDWRVARALLLDFIAGED
jgi:RNA polymerase sigma factor (TIGR02999 family)